jgi:hypothetical protein
MANEFGHNVMRKVFTPPNITEYPRQFWSAEGHMRVFHKPEDVPEEWLPFHPNDKERAAEHAKAKRIAELEAADAQPAADQLAEQSGDQAAPAFIRTPRPKRKGPIDLTGD